MTAAAASHGTCRPRSSERRLEVRRTYSKWANPRWGRYGALKPHPVQLRGSDTHRPHTGTATHNTAPFISPAPARSAPGTTRTPCPRSLALCVVTCSAAACCCVCEKTEKQKWRAGARNRCAAFSSLSRAMRRATLSMSWVAMALCSSSMYAAPLAAAAAAAAAPMVAGWRNG